MLDIEVLSLLMHRNEQHARQQNAFTFYLDDEELKMMYSKESQK